MDSDLELEICRGAGSDSYQVRVLHAAAGGEQTGVLQLDVSGLLGRRETLQDGLLASSVGVRRVAPETERPVQQLGRALFEALFTGGVYGTYRASLVAAQQRGRRLRLVLRLTAPELAALPWEMLYDPEREAYLCRHEPLVRHVPAPYTPDPLEVEPPLRILGLVAAPRGLPALDADTERRRLAEALAEPLTAGRVQLTWVPQATWDRIQDRLLAGEWHVLHFIGHGDYDLGSQEGVLALVGADGRPEVVEASRLADLLGEAQPTPRLVVLNSCSSGKVGTGDLFSGTAAVLVHSGISAAVAMQFAVSDTAAVAFARGFYSALACGRAVDEAAQSGRISILGTRGTLEWITPVLYVRGGVTRLFTLASTSPATAARTVAQPRKPTEVAPPSQQSIRAPRPSAVPRGQPKEAVIGPPVSKRTVASTSRSTTTGRAQPEQPPRSQRLRRRRWIGIAGLAALLAAALVAGVTAAFSTGDGGTAKTVVVEVPGNQMSTDTGVVVAEGELVTITASGGIVTTPGGGTNGPNGDASAGRGATFLPGAPLGALLGAIGDGPPRLLGASGNFHAERGGRLVLEINDQEYQDNTGQFVVQITTRH